MSIQNKQLKVIQSFNNFNDWSEKYSYLIDLGKKLDDYFPHEKKNELNLIKGCQSNVWFYVNLKNNKLIFNGISDALIVSGLIAILLQIYNYSRPSEILNSNISFLNEIGLNKYLSYTRNHGLHFMIQYIYKMAKNYLQ